MLSKTKYNLFVGCYGSQLEETIHWLEFDEADGSLRRIASFAGVENPSFLTVDEQKGFLYVISEIEQGEIISYKIDYQHKTIHEINRKPTLGAPCYVELDDHGNYLFTANYGGGSIIVHKLNYQGSIIKNTDFIPYHSPNQYNLSKLHTIKNVPGTLYFVATDLGVNKLYFYHFDEQSGTLTQIKETSLPSNSGPRHIAFHPFQTKMYVVTEFKSSILVINYDVPLTTVQVEQEVSLLPDDYKGENYGAEIKITDSGKYVFVSNRGHHSIATFEVQQNGRLKPLFHTNTSGEWPRHFSISPTNKYVVVASEHSNCLDVMKVQPNGQLHPMLIENYINLKSPVCLQFIEK